VNRFERCLTKAFFFASDSIGGRNDDDASVKIERHDIVGIGYSRGFGRPMLFMIG
jgi:hypothetical protein